MIHFMKELTRRHEKGNGQEMAHITNINRIAQEAIKYMDRLARDLTFDLIY